MLRPTPAISLSSINWPAQMMYHIISHGQLQAKVLQELNLLYTSRPCAWQHQGEIRRIQHTLRVSVDDILLGSMVIIKRFQIQLRTWDDSLCHPGRLVLTAQVRTCIAGPPNVAQQHMASHLPTGTSKTLVLKTSS